MFFAKNIQFSDNDSFKWDHLQEHFVSLRIFPTVIKKVEQKNWMNKKPLNLFSFDRNF